MPRALYLGIDNGATGGIAALLPEGTVYRVDPMPATDAEVLALLQELWQAIELFPRPIFAYLEHAQAFPKMGVSSAFNYGRGYGAIQMALAAVQIPYDIVTPRKWQAALSCLTHGDKNVSKRRAEQLFPGLKITHAIADALLIAEYGRRIGGLHGEATQEEDTRQAQRARWDAAIGAIETFVTRGLAAQRAVDTAVREAATGAAARDRASAQRPTRSSVRRGRRLSRTDEPGSRD